MKNVLLKTNIATIALVVIVSELARFVSDLTPTRAPTLWIGFASAESEIGPDDVLDRNEAYDDEIDPFYEEWNRKMQGFHPSSLLSLDIAPKSSELFYENIKNPGTLVRGMYYTLSKEEELLVKLVIKSPSGETVYSKESSDGIFSFEAMHSGVYEFEFYNSNWVTPVGVTIAAGSEEHSVLQSRHIKNTQSRLADLKTNVDSIYAQFKYLWLHNHRQMRISRDAQSNLLIYSVVQLFIVGLCSFICITYVKKIVSHKRIL